MNYKLKAKKGEVTDVLIWMITLFVLAVGFFILIFIIPSISNGLKNAGLNNSAEGTAAIASMERIGTHTINNGFMLLFVGLILSVFITSFLVRTHPIFMFLYIFFLGITLLLGMYLGNVYHDLETNPIFASTVNNGSFINLIMNYIVEITLAVGAVSMIIIFAKFSTFGGTQQF